MKKRFPYVELTPTVNIRNIIEDDVDKVFVHTPFRKQMRAFIQDYK